MSKIVEVNNLSYSYGSHKIFDNICFQINEGDFTTIIDADNNGKSTLANILSGNLESQNVKILGKVLNLKNVLYIRNNISSVCENIDGLFILDNVSENIYFILKNKGLSEKQIREKIKEILFPLNKRDLLNKNINELSLGEKYLISIFIAISSEPRLIIFDNCFSMLDMITRRKLFVLLKALNKKGMTILNFTSDNNEILEGNSVIILKNGHILLKSDISNAFNDLDLYEKNNIQLPFIIELSSKLKYYGKVDKIYFSMKKLVDDLWQ